MRAWNDRIRAVYIKRNSWALGKEYQIDTPKGVRCKMADCVEQ